MNTYTIDDIGVYFDGARGQYIGEAVQELAASHGWRYSAARTQSGRQRWPVSRHSSEYTFAWDEAEDFLNDLTAEGVYFGSTESGDWGLWAIEDDEVQA